VKRSLLLALLLSCDRTATAEPQPATAPAKKPDVVAASEAPSAPPAQPTLQKAERRLMGTIWAITLVGDDAAKAREASSRAFDEIARLEQSLSEWLPDSDISHVNQQAGIAPVQVGPELIACVRASLEVARWSDGAYDISWAALRGLWDFSPDSAHVPPSKQKVKSMLPLWNYKNIVLDEAKSTVFLRKKGMQIGLGGVAKGYALDRAGELLIQAGFPDFLIYAGGQVLTHGKKGDRKWRVGIQHPREPRHFAFVEVEDGSLATSGDYEHSYEHEGVTYHHIIDPKTGFPSRSTSSVTLIAKTALWADAVDTAVFIMGPKRGLEALAKAPGGPFEAAVVDPGMHLSVSPNMQLVMTAEVLPDGTLGAPRAP
jgi:thiamine biosynthesis lipoprotein